ncbi:hypothetical protein VTL71DRAFT_15357 [Oculimacula yallundae]|uniref:C2H2-type domain-containing protein n=1 Tax=Oculimacula yallundae TaxID=86028 RepID=A0ABR4CIN6_9HELO
MSGLNIQSPRATHDNVQLDQSALTTHLHDPEVTDHGVKLYPSYRNGQLMVLGEQRYGGGFRCFYQDRITKLCNMYFPTADRLRTHFEVEHFPVTYLNPALRYVCFSCYSQNDNPMGPCSTCHSVDTVLTLIYAIFIGIPSSDWHASGVDDRAKNVQNCTQPIVTSSYALGGSKNSSGGPPQQLRYR